MQSVFLYRFFDEAKLFSAFYLAIEPARFAQIAPAFYFVVFHFSKYTLVNYPAWISLAKIHYFFYVLLKLTADKVRLQLPAWHLPVDAVCFSLLTGRQRLVNVATLHRLLPPNYDLLPPNDDLLPPNDGLLPANDRWWLHFRFIIKLYKSTNRSVFRAGCNLFRAAADGFLRQYFVRVHKPMLMPCCPASADALARRKERKNWSCCVLYLTLKAEWQTC